VPLTMGIAGGVAWIVWGWKEPWLFLSVGLFICCVIIVAVTFAFQFLWHMVFGGTSAYYVVRTFNLPREFLVDQATHVQIEKHEATSGVPTRFDGTLEKQLQIGFWALGIAACYVLFAIASMFIPSARWQ
jgi:hypothetical protein